MSDLSSTIKAVQSALGVDPDGDPRALTWAAIAKAILPGAAPERVITPDVWIDVEHRFLECVEFVLARETEYTKDGLVKVERDPSDPGGTTKYGIDQRSHPGVNIAELTRPEAREIYRVEKWVRFRCGQLKAPWDLAVFDSSVNPGEGWIATALQRAVGAKVDGVIGPDTIAKVNAAGDQQLIELLRARCNYYRARPATIKGKPFRDRFLDGWLARVALLTEATLGRGVEDRVLLA